MQINNTDDGRRSSFWPNLAVSIATPDIIIWLWETLGIAVSVACNQSSVRTDAHHPTYLHTWNKHRQIFTAVLAMGCLSVRLSVRHVPVFCPEEWRYDRAVFSIR